MSQEPCAGCGWFVEGATEGCRAHFDALLARDFSDARYFAVHRLFVDAYCLQHPDEFCRSAKSLAAHLVALGAVIEDGGNPARGSERLLRWLDGDAGLVRPDPPAARGAITLGNLPRDATPGEWADSVRRWAESVWAAYRELHPAARTWARASGTASPAPFGRRARGRATP